MSEDDYNLRESERKKGKQSKMKVKFPNVLLLRKMKAVAVIEALVVPFWHQE